MADVETSAETLPMLTVHDDLEATEKTAPLEQRQEQMDYQDNPLTTIEELPAAADDVSEELSLLPKQSAVEAGAEASENAGDSVNNVGNASVDMSDIQLSSSLPSTPTTERPIKPPRAKSLRSQGPSPMLKPAADPVKPATNPVKGVDRVTAMPSSHTAAAAGTSAALNEAQPLKPKKKSKLDVIMGNKWIVVGILAVIFVILILIIVGVSVSRSPPTEAPAVVEKPAPVIENGLLCGGVSGVWESDNVAVYKGIPYSKAPVGEKRWRHDLKMDLEYCNQLNSTIYKGDEFRGPCHQTNSDTSSSDNQYMGSEDCLYINVWSPKDPKDDVSNRILLPVLVWIHGGFLHAGSGHEKPLLPTAELVKEMDAVIVSFNYRLNVFGWLALDKLKYDAQADYDSGDGSNYGLQDQIRALEWVKEYIHYFGGDAERVTVSGVSSGGTSIYALLVSNSPLFHRAWVSGASPKFGSDQNEPDTTQQVNADVFLRNYDCDKTGDVRSCLMNKSANELADGIPWRQYPVWNGLELVRLPMNNSFIGAVVVPGTVILRESPQDALEKTPFHSIPLLIGTNEFESDMYQVTDVEDGMYWPTYIDYARSRLDTFSREKSDEWLSLYEDLHGNARLHMAKLISDMRVNCPNTFLATQYDEKMKQNMRQAKPVYRYVMTEAPPQNISDLYLSGSRVATHGLDFFTFFYTGEKLTDEFSDLQRRFRANIREFVYNGTIADEHWKPLPKVMEINSTMDQVSDRWNSEYCERWRELYPAYSWMN